MSDPRSLLAAWLARHLGPEASTWLDAQRHLNDTQAWTIAFALVPRKVGKAPLALNADDRSAAHAARVNWQPSDLRCDQAARLLLILDSDDEAVITTRVDRIANTADTAERITIARGLPLFPQPERHLARATEALRTSIDDLFLSVAHANPYPSEHFNHDAWNQMVLKALFVGAPLAPIIGLDQRANPALARMLSDYAAERKAASRSISPELWRCVGPHADERSLELLAWMLATGDAPGKDAAALALHAAGKAGYAILATDPQRSAAINAGTLSWDTLGRDA